MTDDPEEQSEEFDFNSEWNYSKEKLSEVRKLLRRYKAHKTSEAENIILANAMEKYRRTIEDEADERAFTVLLLFYFYTPTLSPLEIGRKLCIYDRTVFKDISNGVERLCVLMFGIDAFAGEDPDYTRILTDAVCDAFAGGESDFMHSISDAVCECINDLRKEV